jgi:hypothetical protein
MGSGAAQAQALSNGSERARNLQVGSMAPTVCRGVMPHVMITPRTICAVSHHGHTHGSPCLGVCTHCDPI